MGGQGLITKDSGSWTVFCTQCGTPWTQRSYAGAHLSHVTADLGVDVGDHEAQLETGHDAGVGQEGVELRNNHLTPHHDK